MKPYKKLYMFHFGFTEVDFVPCEICGGSAVDIHHIDCRGMGGSKLKDSINNLMALCRDHHVQYGDKKQYREMLIQVHQKKLTELVKPKNG